MEQDESPFLVMREVVTQLGVSDTRVRQLADAGRIRFVRTPTGQRLFERVSVEALARLRGAGK